MKGGRYYIRDGERVPEEQAFRGVTKPETKKARKPKPEPEPDSGSETTTQEDTES